MLNSKEFCRRKIARSCLLTGAAAGAIFVATPVLAQATVADENDSVANNEIIVTANRRAERGQDVPIAITAFSSQRLEQQGVTKEQDLQSTVPSLIVGPNGNGSRDAQSFTIRGQGATFQASPGVVVYLNEVPLPASITISQQGGPGNFVDLENLQVLSGPQGTLFGRNTTGGAVLLVPKKPTNEFGGWLKGETGNYKRAYVEGAINIPIVNDKVLLRVSGAYHNRDGFTHDVIFNKNRDNENWHSFRVGLTIRPADGIENYTMGYYAKSANNGAGLIHQAFNIGGLKGVGFCTDPGEPASPIGVPCDVYRSVTAAQNARGPRAVAFSNDVFNSSLSWGLTNTTNIDVSDSLKLRNIISYQKLKINYNYAGDSTVLQQHSISPNVLPAPGIVTSPFPISYFNSTLADELPRDNLRSFTEELQLQGNSLDGKFVWTVGGFYYEQKPDGKQGARAVVYCPAAFTGFCEANYSQYGTSTVSKALYAQGTLDLGVLTPSLDRLKLTAGYRHTWDNIDGFASAYSRSSTNAAQAACGADNRTVNFATALADCQFSASLRTNSPSWVVGLDYKVTDQILLFAKVNRGYKAGGFNNYAVFTNTRTFGPEKVTSYEAGIKADFDLGGVPARFNATAYHLDYKGIQRAGGDFNPATFAGGARTYNADARINGFELEGFIRPAKGVELGGNFAYTDPKYTKYLAQTLTGGVDCKGPVAPGGLLDLSCTMFQYSAKYIWSIHASVEREIGDNLGTLSAFAIYSHSSRQGTDAAFSVSPADFSSVPGYGTLSASLDWRNVAGSNFDLGIFGTNLTNETYRISNTNVFAEGSLLYATTIYGEPRMYGIRAKFHFGGE